MKVKTPTGLMCPMEDKPRNYITDADAVEVPDTPYYRRLVAEGSLIECEAAPVETPGEASRRKA